MFKVPLYYEHTRTNKVYNIYVHDNQTIRERTQVQCSFLRGKKSEWQHLYMYKISYIRNLVIHQKSEVWSGIKNITCLRPYHICFSEIKEAIKIVAKELLYVTMVMIVKIMSILHIRPLNRYGMRKNRFWSRVHMLPLSWGCFHIQAI
jgi:hypothetical protein